jgi:hypothetical protein
MLHLRRVGIGALPLRSNSASFLKQPKDEKNDKQTGLDKAYVPKDDWRLHNPARRVTLHTAQKTRIILFSAFAISLSLLSTPTEAQSVSSFQESCRNIRVAGNTLSATCLRANLTSKDTSILIRGINNNNGVLTVDDLSRLSTYQNSCRSIRIFGITLVARCRRINGTFNLTSVLVPGIHNNNGNLIY